MGSDMSITTIIAKNQTDEDIYFKNLGVSVPGNGQMYLTDYLHLYEIRSDMQLFNEVQIGNIIINDGYQDLDNGSSLSVVFPIFGSNLSHWDSSNESESSTTITKKYINKLLYITPILPKGTYRVGIYFEVKGSVRYRALLDGSVILSGSIEEPKKKWTVVSGFAIRDLELGKHKIKIRYRALNVSNKKVKVSKKVGGKIIFVEKTPIYAAYIKRARVELWRVS